MKRWSVDTDGSETALWWSSGYSDKTGVAIAEDDLRIAMMDGDAAAEAFPALAADVRDAGRLRGLTALFGNRLNREQSFTGAQVAAMLNSKAEVL